MTSKQTFFERMDKPTVAEFLEGPTDIRRGLLAAILLNQMADYWAVEAQVKPNEVPRQLAAQCPEIFLIWDIADASKHARITRGLPRTVTQPGQVMRPRGLFEAPFGMGVFAEAATVFVKPHEGPEHELELVVRVVLALWEERLSRAAQTLA
jgi:hypothetical protein